MIEILNAKNRRISYAAVIVLHEKAEQLSLSIGI